MGEPVADRAGPVGTWVHANKPLLRIGAVLLAALALVFWGQPTGKVILPLAGLLLVVPGPDRVPQPATPTQRRPHSPDMNPAPSDGIGWVRPFVTGVRDAGR